MPSKWPEVSIDDIKAPSKSSIAIGPFGSRMKSNTYTPTGVPVIRGNNLTRGKSLVGDFVFISEELADQLASSNVFPGDLVFPHRGNIGEVGIVPGDKPRYILSTSLMKLTVDKTRVDPLYLFYFFTSTRGRHELLKNASQVGTPGIATPLASLRSIRVPLPPRVEEQRAIANILGSLDDKIELSQQTNETLEGITRALFKSWFIDFDAVRAIVKGEHTESICQRLGLPLALLSLFPTRFQKSGELRDIPGGWRDRTVESVAAKIFSGGTPDTRKAEYWNGALKWFSSGETGNRFVVATEKAITQAGAANSSTRLALPGDILIASAGQGNTRGQTSYCAIETFINQSVIDVRVDADAVHPLWLFYNLAARYEEMRALSDSQSSRGSLTTKLIGGMTITTPDLALMNAFGDLVGPLVAQQIENARQIIALSIIRDTLLPKLIAGGLHVRLAGEV
jgi:type I restriction enzyme, S subunit